MPRKDLKLLKSTHSLTSPKKRSRESPDTFLTPTRQLITWKKEPYRPRMYQLTGELQEKSQLLKIKRIAVHAGLSQ
jgi:hypothetical protein